MNSLPFLCAQKKGFTLIEILIYITISLMLFLYVTQLYFSVMNPLKQRHSIRDQHMQLLVALDVAARDLQSAPIIKQDWKKIHNSCISWVRKGKIISWYFQKGRLIRKVSNSDELNSKKYKISTVLKDIKELTFKPIYKDSKLEGIFVSVKIGKNNVVGSERFIALRG